MPTSKHDPVGFIMLLPIILFFAMIVPRACDSPQEREQRQRQEQDQRAQEQKRTEFRKRFCMDLESTPMSELTPADLETLKNTCGVGR